MIPTWLDFVRAKTGVHEIPGNEHHPFILECLESCVNLGAWAKGRDETPWCGALINLAMLRSGYLGPSRPALASAWIDWGMELPGPWAGCVTVIRKKGGKADPTTGSRRGFHVSLFEEQTDEGLWLRGGNQSDQVKLSFYPALKYDLLAHRWPVVRK